MPFPLKATLFQIERKLCQGRCEETIACRRCKRAKSGWNRAHRDAIWCLTEWVVSASLPFHSSIPSHWRREILQSSSSYMNLPVLLYLASGKCLQSDTHPHSCSWGKAWLSSKFVKWSIEWVNECYPFDPFALTASIKGCWWKSLSYTFGLNCCNIGSGHAHRAFCKSAILLCKWYYVSGKPLFHFIQSCESRLFRAAALTTDYQSDICFKRKEKRTRDRRTLQFLSPVARVRRKHP